METIVDENDKGIDHGMMLLSQAMFLVHIWLMLRARPEVMTVVTVVMFVM